MSIRFRLTVWYTAILAVTLLLFGIVLYFLMSSMTQNQYKEILEKHTEKVYERIGIGLFPSLSGWDLNIQLDDVDTFLSSEIYLQVVNLTNVKDWSSVKVSRSSNAEKSELYIPFTIDTKEKAKEGHAFFETTHIQGYPFLIYNKPLFIRGQLVGVLQATIITGELLTDLRWIFIVSSIITILLASSLGWFMARKALRPIDHVITATEQIEKGEDLDKRIIYEGPNDEIGRLTDKINGMLSRIQVTYTDLEEAYRMQRRFVSDASHELRTPLTTIRGNVDLIQKMWKHSSEDGEISEQEKSVMSKESMQDIAEEAERMSRLVHNLLSLARADAGYEMSKEPLELKSLVEDVIRKSQFIPKNVDWAPGDISTLNGIIVKGSPDYLKQMLFIFIENAFKFTQKGFVRLDARILHNQVGIRILDTGVGMSKEEIPHIFDRFYRADISRGKTVGTGLGLSIAKWIIDEHGGSVEVNTLENQGTTFIIWLPVYFSEE